MNFGVDGLCDRPTTEALLHKRGGFVDGTFAALEMVRIHLEALGLSAFDVRRNETSATGPGQRHLSKESDPRRVLVGQEGLGRHVVGFEQRSPNANGSDAIGPSSTTK
jgi:hypothetical protein